MFDRTKELAGVTIQPFNPLKLYANLCQDDVELLGKVFKILWFADYVEFSSHRSLQRKGLRVVSPVEQTPSPDDLIPG